MRNFLIDNALYLVWGISLAELVLTGILFSDFRKKHEAVVLCMALVCAGLSYDAVVIGIGGLVLEPFLAVLSRVRFILHGMLLPLNVAMCAEAIPLYRRGRIAAWVISVILMLAGGAAGLMREIGIEHFAGVTRFVNLTDKGSWTELVNNVLTYGTVILLVIVGVVILIKHKSPSILLAGGLMFAFAAAAPATGNADLIFLTSMLGELLMALFFTIYEKRHVEELRYY